jgi:hypothetical protein
MTTLCSMPARNSFRKVAPLVWILAAIVSVCISYGGAAHGASITTADLDGICASKDPASAVACRFYILGAAEAAEVTWLNEGAKPLFCIANTVTSAELAAGVENDVNTDIVSNPDIAHVSAIASVVSTLGKLYPCHA